MEEVPKIVRERLRGAAKVEAHPDANLLAGFAEKSLTSREQSQVLEHLAVCEECREAVAVASPEIRVAAAATPAHAASAAARARWPYMRWVAVAACMVVVAGAGFLLRPKAPTAAKQVANETVALKKETAPPAPAEAADKLEAKLQPAAPPIISLEQQKSDLRKFASTDRTRSEFHRQEPRSSEYGFVAAEKSAPGPPPPANLPASTPSSNTGLTIGGPISGGDTGGALAKLDEAKKKEEMAGDKAIREADAKAPASTPENIEVNSANEMVTVEAAPITVQTETVSTKAATAPTVARAKRSDKDLKQASSSAAGLTDWSSSNAVGSFAANLKSPFLRWTISSDGKLLRSVDQGKTWQPVALTAAEVLRALSVTGPEVWVGGERGTLFHSSDSGTNWTQVRLAVGSLVVRSDITHIEFHDPEHGIVTTSDKQNWETSDRGKTWQKK